MFNTHNRLTGEVISQLKSCCTTMTTHCRCVLWVSLSWLIDRFMDPRSIGKAVHCNITMPQCNPKSIHPQCDFNRCFCSCQIDKLLYLFCIFITKLRPCFACSRAIMAWFQYLYPYISFNANFYFEGESTIPQLLLRLMLFTRHTWEDGQ